MNVPLFKFIGDRHDEIVTSMLERSALQDEALQEPFSELVYAYVDALVTKHTDAIDEVFPSLITRFDIAEVAGLPFEVSAAIRALVIAEVEPLPVQEAVTKLDQALEELEAVALRSVSRFLELNAQQSSAAVVIDEH